MEELLFGFLILHWLLVRIWCINNSYDGAGKNSYGKIFVSTSPSLDNHSLEGEDDFRVVDYDKTVNLVFWMQFIRIEPLVDSNNFSKPTHNIQVSLSKEKFQKYPRSQEISKWCWYLSERKPWNFWRRQLCVENLGYSKRRSIGTHEWNGYLL